MPLRTAVVGDVVSYRNAVGESMNCTVTQLQPAVVGTGAWSVANSGTGGTLTAATYSYRITQVVNGVESAPATAKTTVVAAGTTNKCTITLPGVAGVVYKIYGRSAGTELLIGTTAAGATTFDDTGAVTPAGALTTADGRVGLINPTKGLPSNSNKSSYTAIKATTVKSTGAYHLR